MEAALAWRRPQRRLPGEIKPYARHGPEVELFRSLVGSDDLVAKQLVAQRLHPNVISVPEL